jgi:serine/threonine protein kinase
VQASDEALLAGVFTLAYKYADLSALRQAYAGLEANSGQNGGGPADGQRDVVNVLTESGILSPTRGDKVRRAAKLAQLLRQDAIYGMIAIRNRLVGAQMLNACMEESRRSGYHKTLPEVLRERGLLSDSHHTSVDARRKELEDELSGKEQALAATIDLRRDQPEAAELKLGMLLGEVAAKVSFLAKQDLDLAVRAQQRIEQGLSPEEPAPAPPPPKPVGPEIPIPAPRPPEPAVAGAPAGATPPADAGEQDPIKGYELLLKLGQGAMGAVLKARKRDTGEIVALKILKPELAGDREYVERFLREAKAVARMAHNNIIRAIQVGRSGEYYFFAMEFVEGQTCSELIKAKGKLPERFGLMVTRCVAAAMAHAWEHKIVHRDIKPDNIMITKDGEVKLTDLGLARTAKQESTLTITGVVMGSPAYISPEQATGEKNLDSRSDIYSLGASLFHMLTGEVPYDGETPLHVMLKHMNDPLPDVRAKVPQVSEATRHLIFRMMEKRPEQRFQSAQEVEAATRAIEEALAQGRQPALPAGSEQQTQPGAPAQATQVGTGPALVNSSTSFDSGSAEQDRLAHSMAESQSRPGEDEDEGDDDDDQSKSGSRSRKRRGGSREEAPDKKFLMSGETGGPAGKGRDKSKQKEIGERLRRMAQKRKKRF